MSSFYGSQGLDLLKSVTEVVCKPFDDLFDRKTVEIKAKTADGVTFTSAGKVTDKGSDVSLAAKGAVGKHFAFEKVKMTSKGVVSADLELRGAVASTTFYFAGEDGLADSGAKNKADVGVAYEKGSFFGRLNAGLLAGPTFSPHFVYKSGSVAVGAQGSFKATGGLDAATYDAGLAYLGDGYTVATQSSKNFKAASAGYYHKLSWGGAAAKVSYDHTQADKKKAVSGVVGAKYAFDDATTGTMKLGSCGVLSAKYEQQVNQNVKLTLAGKINCADMGSDDHRAAFGIVFSG